MKTRYLALSAVALLAASASAEYLTNEGWDWGIDQRGTGGSTAYVPDVTLTADIAVNATNVYAWDMTVGNTTIGWDIDHNGSVDLTLFNDDVKGAGVEFSAGLNGSFLATTPGTTISVFSEGSTIHFASLTGISSTATIMGANGYIGSTNTGASNVYLPAGDFTGKTQYLAFVFDSYLGSSTPTTVGGWLSLTPVTGDGSKVTRTITLGTWAYDISGGDVVVGVPEPSTYAAGLGLIALGAVGFRRWRKSKTAVKTA